MNRFKNWWIVWSGMTRVWLWQLHKMWIPGLFWCKGLPTEKHLPPPLAPGRQHSTAVLGLHCGQKGKLPITSSMCRTFFLIVIVILWVITRMNNIWVHLNFCLLCYGPFGGIDFWTFSPDTIPWEAGWTYLPHRIRDLLLSVCIRLFEERGGFKIVSPKYIWSLKYEPYVLLYCTLDFGYPLKEQGQSVLFPGHWRTIGNDDFILIRIYHSKTQRGVTFSKRKAILDKTTIAWWKLVMLQNKVCMPYCSSFCEWFDLLMLWRVASWK